MERPWTHEPLVYWFLSLSLTWCVFYTPSGLVYGATQGPDITIPHGWEAKATEQTYAKNGREVAMTPGGGGRRQSAAQIQLEIDAIQDLLTKYPCESGCNGHGKCITLLHLTDTTGETEPIEGPTIHGSGCECDWPPFAGPACGQQCLSTMQNRTISRYMTEEEALVIYGENGTDPALINTYNPNASYGPITIVTPYEAVCSNRGFCHPYTGTSKSISTP